MGRYRIVVRGVVDPAHLPLLDGADVRAAGAGTVIELDVMDDSHLDGLLAMLRDRGTPLVSVQPLGEPAEQPAPVGDGRHEARPTSADAFSGPSGDDQRPPPR